MAIARLSVKVGKAGKAGAHAEYIDREQEKKRKEEQQSDLENRGYGNMPTWAKEDPKLLWQSADLFERKNGSTYREYEIALPREMNREQRLALVEDFIQSEIGSKYPYQFAIHNPKAMDGNDQPHVHLMFNERLQDGIERDPEQYFKRYNSKNPERGGAKKDNTGKSYQERKTDIKELRQRWADLCNSHLEKHQIDSRIDMRSYKEQGIAKEPEQKLLPSQANDPAIREALQVLRDANKAVKQLVREPLEISPKQQIKKPKQPKDIFKMPHPDTLKKMDMKMRLRTFLAQANEIAKHLEAQRRKEIKAKMAELRDRIHEHDQKEPMFFKKKWREEREAFVEEYHSNQEKLKRPFETYLSHVQKQMKNHNVWKTYDIDDDMKKVERMERVERFEKQVEALRMNNVKVSQKTKEKDLGNTFEM